MLNVKGGLFRKRTGWIALLITGCFLGLGARLVYLQAYTHEFWLTESQNQTRQLQVLQAKRGDILDRSGKLLAGTRTWYELGVDPEVLKTDVSGNLPKLARLLGISRKDLDEMVRPGIFRNNDGKERAIRWRKLTETEDREWVEAVQALRIKGIYANRSFRRIYPHGGLAAQTIGFINKELDPVTGIEATMNDFLQGAPGWRKTEKDARRREMAQFREREFPARDGANVVLSLQLEIQSVVERVLAEAAEKYTPETAVVLVSDPFSGDLLAVSSYPGFDLNDFGQSSPGEQKNRAFTDAYEPGSTFKVFAIARAMEDGLIEEGTLFDCDLPVWTYQGKPIRLPADHKPMGTLDLREVLIKSSNRASAQVGFMLGGDGLEQLSRDFGFFSLSGLPVTGEIDGLEPQRQGVRWNGYTVSRWPIGHGLSITAFQVHRAMGVIASGGVLVEPRLVLGTKDREGRFLPFPGERNHKRVISRETAARVTAILERVTAPGGTAPKADIPGYRVAGKTGTTRKLENGQYSNRRHIASFSGFFPAEDPRVLITVVVNEPKANYPGYGGLVAGPIFKEIGSELIPLLGVPLPQPTPVLVESNR